MVLTGFPSGELGIWMKGLLMRTVEAHKPGPLLILPDGSCTYGGLRCIKLRADKKTLLTGGADGYINAWDIRQTVDDQPQCVLFALSASRSEPGTARAEWPS